ncbi:MAG: methyl-accepting chemotaxis protein [Thermodesulfovibrionales bacterium]
MDKYINTTFAVYISQVLGYLTPENKIAFAIILFLQLIFLFWILKLLYSWYQLRADKRQMLNCEDVKVLVEAREKYFGGDEKSNQDESKIFRDFCKNKSVNENKAVIKHLKIIFISGWRERRLEIGELLNHTKHILFQNNNFLRSILSSFIVLGLLGTLFGLADSLAHLSPVVGSGGFQQTNEGISFSLAQLLSHIKSAFAPSIWGVTFTVIGVLIYGAYLRFGCTPIKSTLERLTLTVWLPQLCPTTSQRLIEQSEQHMRKNLEAVSKFIELSDSVQSEVSVFNHNLNQANTVTASLSTAANEINTAANVFNSGFANQLVEFSSTFTRSVSRLTTFQEEIRTLYQKMIDESDTFQKSINKTIEAKDSRINNILKTFKSYEDAYIAERGQIDAKMQKFLDEATEVNTSINAQNRKLFDDISSQLNQSLRGIENSLNVGLSGIAQKFDSFDVPIKNAAEKIEGSYENYYKHMTGIIMDLQNEIKSQNNKYEQHLISLSNVKQSIETLLKYLSKNSQVQATEIQNLSQVISKLALDINSLSSNINSHSLNADNFNNSVSVIEQNIKSLGKGAQILIETSTSIAPLANTISVFSETVKKLQRSVEVISKPITQPQQKILQDVPTKKRRLKKLKKIFPTFLFWVSEE